VVGDARPLLERSSARTPLLMPELDVVVHELIRFAKHSCLRNASSRAR
jgi:hypothetical protein